MKIVSGQYGGRRLISPTDKRIRPTSDKVRGAVFNMLESRGGVAGVRVLDAFCGSGALGIEALSRGALSCDFFDKDPALAKRNARALECEDFCTFKRGDSTKTVFNEGAYGLVFLDPPYGKGFVDVMLDRFFSVNIVQPDGWIVCETEEDLALKHQGYFKDSEKTYGDIKITLLHNVKQ